jgi:hypothetical protein
MRAHVPEADRKIVFDKFRAARHLSHAVDKDYSGSGSAPLAGLQVTTEDNNGWKEELLWARPS